MKRGILLSLCLAALLAGFTAYTPAARADVDPSVQQARQNERWYEAQLRQQNQQFFQQQQAQQQQQLQQQQAQWLQQQGQGQ
jgi:hypothetical protein